MTDEQTKGGEAESTAEQNRPSEEQVQDKWTIVIAVVLMAIFLTWIGCAIAVWMGWVI